MNCVFVSNSPWCEDYVASIATIKHYCANHGLEFFLSTEPKINWQHYYCERFYICELLKKYDRVLYLDADIVITPKAPNIFDIVPTNCFGAFDENCGGIMDRNPMVEPLLHICPEWPKNDYGYRFFNAGVMVVSKEHLFALENFLNPPNEPALWTHWPDQTYLNYLVSVANLPFHNITSNFNRMSMGEPSTREKRFDASFIHYAGSTEYYEKQKYEVMKEDVRILYPD